ncbi:MAG TPA: diacylglycerol kinase family protein [Flavobacteriales bacterium]|nr:diacylglycerol kinase family protein [Flavobacteriales bacterium]
MKNSRYLFIVNPVSGTGKQKGVEKYIQDAAAKYNVEALIELTKSRGHASEIAKKASEQGLDVVGIVGGDGSVNEAGKSLLHTNTAMGIIPTGSGNGLARHLKIPLEIKDAVERVFTGKRTAMDVGKLENHVFLSTAGFGFDAHVAHLFAKEKKRGFGTYIKTVRRELFHFKPFVFFLKNEQVVEKAFMLSVANIPQFGNNFTINPNASEADGLLNCTLIKPFPKYKIPYITSRFFRQSINKSTYFREWAGEEFEIELPHLFAHVDGEPVFLNRNKFRCHVEKACLDVIS